MFFILYVIVEIGVWVGVERLFSLVRILKNR